MKSRPVAIRWTLCLLAGLTLLALPQPVEAQEKGDKPAKLLRHVVLFQFKSDVTKDQLKEVTDAFAALPKKIPAIHAFEWGTDVSVENRSEGFTHCFLVTFRSAKDRDDYIPHAAHQEFVKLLLPRLEKVLVVDYWTN